MMKYFIFSLSVLKLHHFCEFMKDQVWAIRKVCADSFSQFAMRCRRETRELVLTEHFIRLLDDNSRWVKIAAYKSLGPFIATFIRTETEKAEFLKKQEEKAALRKAIEESQANDKKNDQIEATATETRSDQKNSTSKSSVVDETNNNKQSDRLGEQKSEASAAATSQDVHMTDTTDVASPNSSDAAMPSEEYNLEQKKNF